LKSGLRVYCHIPGIGHKLRPGEEVIICGHGPNDLPYTKYHVIRGPRFDLSKIVVVPEWGERKSSRSVYGLKKRRTTQEMLEADRRYLKKLNKKHVRHRIVSHIQYKTLWDKIQSEKYSNRYQNLKERYYFIYNEKKFFESSTYKFCNV
jgi:hypothetical protein